MHVVNATEIDLRGLTKPFILEVMKKCLEDHDNMHCYDRCEDAVVCTPDDCPEPEWLEGDVKDLLRYEDKCFVHHSGGDRRHVLGPENIAVLEVVQLAETTFKSTHTVLLKYLNGHPVHDWRAVYGVNEDERRIELWMD